MLDKLNKFKSVANKHCELLNDFCFKAAYFKDISIVLELNEIGLSFTKTKSFDFEEIFYIID